MPPKSKAAAAKTDGPEVELQADGPDLPVTGSQTEQHPALGGDPDAEIEQRTADGTAAPGHFRKTFVVDVELDDPAVLAAGHMVVMRQEAAQRGLRATGDAKLVDTEVTRHARAVSTALTYEMPVRPAITAQPEPAPEQA